MRQNKTIESFLKIYNGHLAGTDEIFIKKIVLGAQDIAVQRSAPDRFFLTSSQLSVSCQEHKQLYEVKLFDDGKRFLTKLNSSAEFNKPDPDFADIKYLAALLELLEITVYFKDEKVLQIGLEPKRMAGDRGQGPYSIERIHKFLEGPWMDLFDTSLWARMRQWTRAFQPPGAFQTQDL